MPLGATVTFATVDANGTAAATFAVTSTSISPVLTAPALFSSHVLFKFNADTSNSATFQAVHKGTSQITVSEGGNTHAIDVIVGDPATIGSEHQEVNALIVPVAHQTGIPPQFIKGHIKHESSDKYDPLSYRYEPFGESVGDNTLVSRDENYRSTNLHFIEHRYETFGDILDIPLEAGAKLIKADQVNYPSLGFQLKIECDTVPRPIQPLNMNDTQTDDLVSVAEILKCNDGAMNWVTNPSLRFWAAQMYAAPFVAQRSLAASYGLMQVTFEVAVHDLEWEGTVNGDKNPSYLFDTAANVALGGGSVNLGATIVQRAFSQNNSSSSSPDNAWVSYDAFRDAFLPAWRRYNRRRANYNGLVRSAVINLGPVTGRPLF